MSTKKPVLVFDFDGVLADTEQIYIDFVHRFSRLSKGRIKRRIRRDSELVETQSRWWSRLFEKLFYYQFNRYVRTHNKDLLLESKVQEVRQLTGKKYILTRSTEKVCKAILGPYIKDFQIIIDRHQFANKAQGLEQIRQMEETNFKNIFFVTDTVRDIQEVREVLDIANTFGVLWGFSDYKTLRAYLPEENILVNSFEAISSRIVDSRG